MGLYNQSMSYGGMGMNSMFHPSAGYMPTVDQGKGKSREVDFEAAFAQAATMFTTETSSARIVEVDNSVADLEEAVAKTTLQTEPTTEFKQYVYPFNISNISGS